MFTSFLGRLRPRGRRTRRLVLVLALVVVAAAATGGWLLLRDEESAAATSSTATVASQTLQETVTASGTVSAARTSELSFGVSGIVRDVFVEPGDTVRKGQRLAAVDDEVLQAELAAAQSSLDAAQESYDEAVDDGSDEQVASSSAAVLAAESSLTEAEDAAGDAVLRATHAGTVTAVDLEVGDSAGSGSSSGSGSAGGTSMGGSSSSTTSSDSSGTITVVSTGSFVLDATIASSDVEKVSVGLQAELTVSGVEETVYGTVSEVGLVAETDSSGAAVFPVTIKVTDQRDDLYGGTSADVSIIVSQRADVLTVDSRAVQTDGDSTYVDQVVDEATGETARTEVEVGETSGMATEVLSGLAEGDVVEVPGFAGAGGGGGDQDRQDRMRQMQEGGFSPPEGFEPPSGGGFPGGNQ